VIRRVGKVTLRQLQGVDAAVVVTENAGVILVAHNAPFDLQVAAGILGNDYRSIDTLQLAKRYLPDAPNHKLGTLMYYCGLTRRKNTHSAVEDCMICRDLLMHIMTITGRDV
jgi:DNA polymerase III epsilon subunit-like protein